MARKKRYFLPYELDAFGNVANIANLAGIPAASVAYGNLLMWQHVWRTKSDVVTTAHIQAFFGGDVCAALVLFGHLEVSEVGWRVKGAKEWLRVMGAQSQAGKDHSNNLRRGPGSPPASVPKGSVAAPKPAGSPPALPATSDQRPATIEAKSLAGETPPAPRKRKPKAPESPPDPRHNPLLRALVDFVPGYALDPRDFKAITSMLAKAEPFEVLLRWRRANARSDYPTVRAIWELDRNWTHFATDAPKGADPNAGILSRPAVYVRPPERNPIEVPPEMEIPL